MTFGTGCLYDTFRIYVTIIYCTVGHIDPFVVAMRCCAKAFRTDMSPGKHKM